MRRFIAILLFAAFALPFLLPALALGQDADAGLPACCRRNGVHHCAMSMAEKQAATAADSKEMRWKAQLERCPCCPATLTVVHVNPLAVPSARAAFAEFFGHPSGIVQTESKWRIARDRSRQKRGPPTMSLA